MEEERVVQQLKKQLEGKVSAESLDWLPRTATAQKYIKNQALSETGDVLSLQAIDKLVKGDKTVQQRTTEIKRAIKDRLILSERSKLGVNDAIGGILEESSPHAMIDVCVLCPVGLFCCVVPLVGLPVANESSFGWQRGTEINP